MDPSLSELSASLGSNQHLNRTHLTRQSSTAAGRLMPNGDCARVVCCRGDSRSSFRPCDDDDVVLSPPCLGKMIRRERVAYMQKVTVVIVLTFDEEQSCSSMTVVLVWLPSSYER
ncbi:hypothetical protein JOB18_038674 [Solea senegalensis]|uniref:Uncharacterized protein n=1 Tax=Solea senegalensis TaxID=28829 RepID=A0AAV6R8R6_SOLSE|nr:hypothetical protein JOB18_038674 [Solea senegalensis]